MSFLLRKPENAAWKFISCFLKRLTPRGKRVAENAGAGSGTGGTGDGSGVGSAWGGSGSGSGMGLGRTSGPPAVGKSSGDISFPALQLRHGSRTIIKSHPALGLADDVIQHERGGNEGDECHHPRRSQRVRHSSRLSAHEDGVPIHSWCSHSWQQRGDSGKSNHDRDYQRDDYQNPAGQEHNLAHQLGLHYVIPAHCSLLASQVFEREQGSARIIGLLLPYLNAVEPVNYYGVSCSEG